MHPLPISFILLLKGVEGNEKIAVPEDTEKKKNKRRQNRISLQILDYNSSCRKKSAV